jgi:hypothetical protein
MPFVSSVDASPPRTRIGGRCPALTYVNRLVASSYRLKKNVANFSGAVDAYTCWFKFEISLEALNPSPRPALMASVHCRNWLRIDDCKVAISSAAEMPLPATSPMARAS